MGAQIAKRLVPATILIYAIAASGLVNAQHGAAVQTSFNASLRDFLQRRLTDSHYGPDRSTRYSTAIIRLKGTTTEDVAVYISGPGWCGSGGCTLLMLNAEPSSFKVLGQTTIVQLPIYLLPGTSHGHPNIGVRVQGGGILPGYVAKLSFDGTKYPQNPSVPPAQRLTGFVDGEKLISSTGDSQLLYK